MEKHVLLSAPCPGDPARNLQFPAQKSGSFRSIFQGKKEKQKNMPFILDRFRIIGLNWIGVLVVLLATLPQRGSSEEWDGVIVTQADYQALRAIKQSFSDPNGILRSWNDTGLTACSGGWAGIKCAQGQVIVIELPWRGLGGQISQKIGQLAALRKLILHDNYIGGLIPAALGSLPNLKGLHLFNNHLVGQIPAELGNCPSLQSLDLSNNSLVGVIPTALFNSTKLYRLNLSHNSLSGLVPISLTRLVSVTFVDLSYNNISGSIPDTWENQTGRDPYQLRSLFLDHNFISGGIPVSLSRLDKLEEISLSNNLIDGTMPDEIGFLSQLLSLDFSNNNIHGNFSAAFCNLTSLIFLNLANNHLENQIPDSLDRLQNLSRLDLSENNFVGPVPPSLAKMPNLDFLNVSYNNLSGPVPLQLAEKFNASSFKGNLLLCGYDVSVPCPAPSPSSHNPQLPPAKSHHHKLINKNVILIVIGALLVVVLVICCILLLCLIDRRTSATEKGTRGGTAAAQGNKAIEADVEAGGEIGGKLVHFDGPLAFTADDLLCATAEIMGKSTYGTVYRATLQDGSQVAVKRLREKIAKGQKEFETEVNALGQIRHPNLLALRAYYIGPKGEKLLVFDFMPKGNLASFLHARGPDTPINWATRLNIAIGVTQGITHLHTQLNMVHGNLTSSNILLDENNNTKVSDYSLSRLMTAAANSNVIATAGALGYRAPELSKLKKASTKTDIYSLGVILLELLTGKSPGEAMNGIDLPQWVASTVKEEWTNEVFDLELMSDASATGDELLNVLKLAMLCVEDVPAARPEAQQVLQRLMEMKPDVTTEGPTAEEVGELSND